MGGFFDGKVISPGTVTEDKLSNDVKQKLNTSGGGAGDVAITQALGNSTTAVMSQKAVTEAFYADPESRQALCIGKGAEVDPELISMAVGVDAKVEINRDYSVAVGYYSRAGNDYSTAVGATAQAMGYRSTALGYDSKARGQLSFAIGTEVSAIGEYSIAIGNDIGTSSKSVFISPAGRIAGANSVGIGYGVEVAIDSVAIGANSAASLGRSVSIGSNTYSSGDCSIAIGSGSRTENETGIVVGVDSTASRGSVTLGYGAGSQSHSISVGADSKSSDLSVAIGFNADAEVAKAVAVGSEAVVVGTNGIAIGADSKSTDAAATSIGYKATANGDNSIALGHVAKTIGDNTIAIGHNAVADGDQSMAIGYNSSCTDAVCLGIECSASSGSISVGLEAEARDYSVAVGLMTRVDSVGSVSIGPLTYVAADLSVAIGTESCVDSYDILDDEDGVVSFGRTKPPTSSGYYFTRRIINVSPGVNEDDVVTVKQLTSMMNGLAAAFATKLSVKYDIHLEDADIQEVVAMATDASIKSFERASSGVNVK